MPKLAETIDPALDVQLVRAGQKVWRALFERDELIAEAAALGASLRAIASATGVSYETVRRIIDRKRRPDAS